MSAASKVTASFFYVADKRPVIVFSLPEDAILLQKSFNGAEVYHNKTHVFLPTPHGLEFVRGGSKGETAYVFHTADQALHWFQKLDGYGTMYPDGDFPKRTVFIGTHGQGYSGEPIWPGVA